MSTPKKPSRLTDKLVTRKDPRRSVKSFADSEDGVRSFIQTRTAYDSKGIASITKDESEEGVWHVAFKGSRMLRVYVGTHPRAADFDIE
jgi:hypothetical protein